MNKKLNVINTGEEIHLSKENYLKYLNSILQRQIVDEEYEECEKTRNLIQEIVKNVSKI